MPQSADEPHPGSASKAILISIAAADLVTGIVGILLVRHADHQINRVPLGAAPRPVSVIAAAQSQFRDSRSYIGAVESWIEANVGPQYISAYVNAVIVRPGAVVTHGQVLATLDCAHPTAASRAAEMAARAATERQRATADEAARERSMLDGGFIAANDVEQKVAQSTSERAQVLETQARVQAASEDVGDCTLRAPFDGEIATRGFDPGAFVTPGASIVSVVDRSTVRVVVDAPEKDFAVVSPGTVAHLEMVATGATLDATVSRRAPKADPRTRTIRFEIDIADPKRQFPTATTAVVRIDVGEPVAATEVPIYAATAQEHKAKLFVVDHDAAHLRTLEILGESGGGFFFDPKVLPPSSQVVTEGRALLTDGDAVTATLEPPRPASNAAPEGGRGGGYGRPL